MSAESDIVPGTNLTRTQAQFRQGVAACVLGFVALAVAGWMYWRASAILGAAKWPQALGIVESCEVIKTVGTRSGEQFQVHIKYSYEVDGKSFHGDRYNTHNDYTNGEPEARNVVQTYLAGGRCYVAYSPSDPAQSYIDPSTSWHTQTTVVISVVIAIAGLCFLVLGLAKLFLPNMFFR